MTQEKINEYFQSDLGQQCNFLFSTSDDRVFIRHMEAKSHTLGELDPDTKPLDNKEIIQWVEL